MTVTDPEICCVCPEKIDSTKEIISKHRDVKYRQGKEGFEGQGVTAKSFAALSSLKKCSPFSVSRRISGELRKLRNLTQPYFLDLAASGWMFTWLLLCMLFVVTGIAFFLITGTLILFRRFKPEVVEKILDGDSGFFGLMFDMWHTSGGAVIGVLTIVGVISFAANYKRLKGHRWYPWLLLSGIVFILLIINLVNTGIGFIARDLTDYLVAKDSANTYLTLIIYGACFAVVLPIRSLQYYSTQKLSIYWRKWLSERLIASYMGHRAYYELNPNDEENTRVDNPDQRIADDARSFTRASLDFTVGVFDALLTFVLNIMVLVDISKALTIALFIYAAIATIVLIVSSHKLVRINYDQLRCEADFRYGLVHVRNNAEAIAFYGGEGPETRETQRRLDGLVDNYNLLIKWQVIISVIRRSFGYAGNFFPYMILAPAYLRGALGYGSLLQARFAFGEVEYALTFIVNNIDDMAAWWAGISRLENFQATVEDINRKGELRLKAAADCKIHQNELNDLESGNPEINAEKEAILLRNIRVEAPGSQQLLVNDLSLSLAAGQRILVVGPSGCGKTSVLRVASGLWQPKAGSVERPPVGKLLFVPQRPYMLLGSLREQLCYPASQDKFTDDQLREVLAEVRLSSLVARYPDLGIKQDWPRLLSLGEQQRLAFARLLLHEPRFAVLDEATSALDVNTEQILYEKLTERGVALISVGHRPTLAAFHEQVLELKGDGKWSLIPAASYSFNHH